MAQVILFAKQKWRHSCRGQLYGHQGGVGMDIYTLLMLGVKKVTNESLVCSAGTVPDALR